MIQPDPPSLRLEVLCHNGCDEGRLEVLLPSHPTQISPEYASKPCPDCEDGFLESVECEVGGPRCAGDELTVGRDLIGRVREFRKAGDYSKAANGVPYVDEWLACVPCWIDELTDARVVETMRQSEARGLRLRQAEATNPLVHFALIASALGGWR